MSAVIRCNRFFGKESVIPEYVFTGYVRNNPWEFCYFDMDKIEKVMMQCAADQLGFSIDKLYWDSGVLFSYEEEYDEADDEFEPIASYESLLIEDAWDYKNELEGLGLDYTVPDEML